MATNNVRKSFTFTTVRFVYRNEDNALLDGSVDIPGAVQIDRANGLVRKACGYKNVIPLECNQWHKVYECTIAEFMSVAHEVSDTDTDPDTDPDTK